MEAREEDMTEEGISYVAMRNLFVREARDAMEVRVEKKTRSTHIRESAERMRLGQTVKPPFFFFFLLCPFSDESLT